MNKINRRTFLQQGLLAGTSLAIPMPAHPFSAQQNKHYFLQIFVAGGLDASYLFDARDLVFTDKNLLQNYSKQAPIRWIDGEGTSHKVSPIVHPLLKHKKNFSVLKGVVMSDSFDGHEQNVNYTFTGNAFGEINIPSLFSNRSLNSVQSVQIGSLSMNTTNPGDLFITSAPIIKSIKTQLNKGFDIDAQDPLFNFIQQQNNQYSSKTDVFARATHRLNNSFSALPTLVTRLKKMKISTTQDKLLENLDLVKELFTNNVTNSAILVLNYPVSTIDVHGAEVATKHHKTIEKIVQDLDRTMSYLNNTAFNQSSSLMDVTTFTFSSEFSRTMRQIGRPIDQTGTDHNPLNNVVMVGGKGIKGDLIMGASDFEQVDENLSKAHLRLDSNKLKIMGRPFDFKTYRPLYNYQPDQYDVNEYLNYSCLQNTFLKLFNISKKYYRYTDRDKKRPFKVLQKLLS